MAKLNGFDATKVKPAVGFDPLPAGWYTVIINASEQKATKKGDGEYLKLEMSVLDGEHKGRKLFCNLNLANPNAQTVEIARGQLSAICHAVGVMTPQDSSELHNKPFMVKVNVRRGQNDELQNDVKVFKPVEKGATSNGGNGATEGGSKAKRWQPRRTTKPEAVTAPVGGNDDDDEHDEHEGDE